MDDLVAFLHARLDEREARARKIQAELDEDYYADSANLVRRMADPARELREVAAKREIAGLHTGGHECSGWNDTYRTFDSCMYFHDFETCTTLRHLAAVDSDHPDYRPEWAPVTGEDATTQADSAAP